MNLIFNQKQTLNKLFIIAVAAAATAGGDTQFVRYTPAAANGVGGGYIVVFFFSILAPNLILFLISLILNLDCC